MYDNQLEPYVHRHTKNQVVPQFTDQELLTAYLFGVGYEKRLVLKELYECIENHYGDWFPDLPTYATFNRRLNNLNAAFPVILAGIVKRWQASASNSQDHVFLLTDSMPIITCSGSRNGVVAAEITDKGYNSTKKMYFRGIKLHAISISERGTIPALTHLMLSSASEHDLNAQRDILTNNCGHYMFADKAFKDSDLDDLYEAGGGKMFIPIKSKKGRSIEDKQRHKAADDLYGKLVSSIRQPIESFFNWIIEKTDIQRASKVRSTKGLLVHTLGKITAAIYRRLDDLELV